MTEIKSKAVSLTVHPSTHQKLKKVSYMKRLSVNQAINDAIQQYIEQNQDMIIKYDNTYPEDN